MAEEKKNNASKLPRMRTIELMYKPVFDVHLNMAIDFYTRMQINDRSMGIMYPEKFVPIAEKSNQICDLGKWQLEEACDAFSRCAKREIEPNSLILWTSLKHISKKNFVKFACNTVEKKEVNPDKICFAITDHILQADSQQISQNFKELRDYGFQIAIDDFGVEYSSLANLGQYEVDYIGIDESLTKNIMTDERQQNMLQGILDFAKKIESHTMVAGVDTPEKAELIKKLGADRMSGSLYGDFIKENQITI